MTEETNNDPLPVRSGKGGVILSVRLMPKASKDEVQFVEQTETGSVLKARVRAIPDKGKANKALIALVADWVGVPKSTISISSGSKSRLKSVHFSGDETELMTAIINKINDLND